MTAPATSTRAKAVIIDQGVIRQQDVLIRGYTAGGAKISTSTILEVGQQLLLRMTHVEGKLFSSFSEVNVDPRKDVSFEVQAVVISAEQAPSSVNRFHLEVKFSGNYRFISTENPVA